MMRWVDRFSQKHRGFGIPNLMLYIIICNAAVYLFSMMGTNTSLMYLLTFNPERIFAGEIWRLVTFAIVPETVQLLWMALTLYFYYFIGSTLENQWGTCKFTIYYAFGMLFTVIYGLFVYLFFNVNIAVGAQYINLSMFFSYATLYPDNQVLLFFIIPIKIKWLALLNALFFVFGLITNPFPLNLVPLIAVLNYLMFCGSDLIYYIRQRSGRYTRGTINFKRASRKFKRETKNKQFNRQCAVCGKTDTDYPEINFRFCSRCEGYHCFCDEHISNHIHFSE